MVVCLPVSSVKKYSAPILFLLPALVVLAMVSFYPLVFGFYMAFTDMSTTKGKWISWDFVGLENFRRIVEELLTPELGLGRALLNTVFFTVVNVALQVLVGVAFAFMLNSDKLLWRRFWQAVFIVPWAVPGYISIMAWFFLYQYSYGYFNQILMNLGLERIDWLGQRLDTFWPWVSINATNVWLAYPFIMTVTLAALQTLPRDLLDAAKVDGAGGWQTFRYVVLPHIKPPLTIATVLTTITTFQQFGVVWLLTGGGPQIFVKAIGTTIYVTDLLMTYGYRTIWQFGDYGYGAAFSIFLALLVVPASIYAMKKLRVVGE
ncbi:carbohydrate ABC transporter permease [Thermofilum pendens]|uniref:carbohydrate ABC transporter permease n=1 Tax=Thermofilum pendens TaxID=2269 RepID=UPI000A81A7C1|nr:sugar ABC transporter permease [Thermofilum pendens]